MTRAHVNLIFRKISRKLFKNSAKTLRKEKISYKNISNFPGDLVQNFDRTHAIFQEKEIPKEQMF